MADGGACSSDPFRLPCHGDELTYPFGNGLVVRYGYSSRLVSSTVAVAGVGAEFPPPTQEPYRLLYFVVTDHMRTTIAILRVVLKEGLVALCRPSKVMVIDYLETIEVYRKQGLATNLANFVKGIAEAHGMGLYACCDLRSMDFWTRRGFGIETLPEVQDACNPADDFSPGETVLLRAGKGYNEYQPGNGDRGGVIRPFCYNHYGDLPDSSRAEDGNINCMDDTLAAVPMADVAGDETLSKMRSVGMGNGTTPVVTIGITPTGGPGTSATNHRRVVSGASVRHERRPLEPRTAADSRCHDFPSEQVQEPHAPSHLQSQSMWSGNQDWQESPVIAREHIAVQALTALPGNPSTSIVDLTGNDGLGTSGQQTLDEQEEAQVQMAIAMSLAENEAPRNASDVVLGRPGEPGEFSWQPTLAVANSPGDDTETDEEPGYGAQAPAGETPWTAVGNPSSRTTIPSTTVATTASISSITDDSPNSVVVSAQSNAANVAEAVEVASILAKVTTAIGPDGKSDSIINARRDSESLGGLQLDGGKDESGVSTEGAVSGADGRERSRAVRGRGHEDHNFRRLRRRRDETGASTVGERSPSRSDREPPARIEEQRPTHPLMNDDMGSLPGHDTKRSGTGSPRSNIKPSWIYSNKNCTSSDTTEGGQEADDAVNGAVQGSPCRSSSPSSKDISRGWKDPHSPSHIDGSMKMSIDSMASSITNARNANGDSLDGKPTPRGSFDPGAPVPFFSEYGVPEAATVPLDSRPSTASAMDTTHRIVGWSQSQGYNPASISDTSASTFPPNSNVNESPSCGGSTRDVPPRGNYGAGVGSEQRDSAMSENNPDVPLSRLSQPADDMSSRIPLQDSLSVVSPGIGDGIIPGGSSYLPEVDVQNEAFLREAGMDPGTARAFLSGDGGSLSDDDFAGNDKNICNLLSAATWDDEDGEEWKQALEASRKSHEEEMLKRATQESQAEAVAAMAASSGEGSTAPSWPGFAGAATSAVGGVRIMTSSTAHEEQMRMGGGAFTMNEPAMGDAARTATVSTERHGGPSVAGGSGGGGGANGSGHCKAGGGQASGSAGTANASWLGPWDEPSEFVAYVGKGKGRCRD